MGLVQEKFQVEFPDKGLNHEWVSDKSARRSKSAPDYLNCLPPGTDIDAQQQIDSPAIARVMDGETDRTPTTAEHYRKGYKRFDVKPTDDQYTAEHVDTFYGEAKSGSDVGFCERGNLLDRI